MAWKDAQITEKECEKILKLAEECLDLSGDYVEMGCYTGDTSLLLTDIIFSGPRRSRLSTLRVVHVPRGGLPQGSRANSPTEALRNAQKRQYSVNGHRLFIYDSFEGLPEKSEFDASALGESFQKGELVVSKRMVKERFLKAGLPVPVIKKAWFNELTDADMPEKIAFAFLDGDFYESIRDSLRLVGDKMTNGGVIVVHDYNNLALPGVRRAVDEWKTNRKIEIYESMAVIRID